MERILFVNACVRPQSRTRRLAQTVLDCLPGRVEEVCLADARIEPLNNARLEAREGNTDASMLRWARQFAAADEVLFAAPYWDMAFPACLKAYLEAVTVSGVTFRYDGQGVPVGLCRAKRLIYVATAGGPIVGENMGFAYVSALARTFYGIGDVRYFDAQGLDIAGADVEMLLRRAEQGIADALRP